MNTRGESLIPPPSAVTISTNDTKVKVVTLHSWPTTNPLYARVLFRVYFSDGEGACKEIWLSPADAQRLGHSLNAAGHGTLAGSAMLDRQEVGLAIDALATLVQSREPNDYRPLLRKLQEAYKRDE